MDTCEFLDLASVLVESCIEVLRSFGLQHATRNHELGQLQDCLSDLFEALLFVRFFGIILYFVHRATHVKCSACLTVHRFLVRKVGHFRLA